MARPSNEELMKEREDLRAEIDALKAQLEAAQAPTTDGHADALERVRVLEETVANLTAELEAVARTGAESAVASDPVTLDPTGWPLNPGLQDGRGVKTPGYLRWLYKAHPAIYAAKRGGSEPPQGD
jgi:hypothetical protein